MYSSAAPNRVSFASDVSFAPSPSSNTARGPNTLGVGSGSEGLHSASASSLIFHLGGMCIRDYQLALQRSVNELKSREQQVNQLYSCLLDREETIARLNRELDSLKQHTAALKRTIERTPSGAASGLAAATLNGRGGTLISTHELAGELHQTVATPLPLLHSSHTTDGSTLLSKSRRDRLRAALAKNDLLGRLDFEQADGLISRMVEKRVSPGEVIIKEGEAGTQVFIMEDGEVDIHREGQFLCRLLAPMVFGELAVIYNAPRSATVTAATHCRLWTIENKTFHKCMNRIRQRTINKIALEMKGISIFSSLSKTTLSSIVDAGEELHFSQGSHVSIAPGTLYIITEGFLTAKSLLCSCGDVDGHKSVPPDDTCRPHIIEIPATSCFCFQLSQNVIEALSQSTSHDTSDIFYLSPAEVLNLKAAESSLTRITFYRLDTNYVLRALDKKQKQAAGLGAELHKTASPMPSEAGSAPESLRNSSVEPQMAIADLSIIALLPSRDSFSHLFFVVDSRTALRRNAVILDNCEGQPQQQQSSDSNPPILTGRRTGCYAMRWVLRSRADAAGMGERLSNEREHLLVCKPCEFIVQLIATMQDPVSVYLVYEICLGGTLESLMNATSSTQGGSNGLGTPTSTSFSIINSIRRQNRPSNPNSSGTSNVGAPRASGIEDDWARFYVACVVEALDFLHSNGIVHRNVCPASVLITSSGYGKLGDFTWTKSIGARSRTFSLCGAVERLAPEVMLNKGHGLAADRWSVGILLYELLVGKAPFLRDDPMLTCSAILAHAGGPNSTTSSSNSGGEADSLEFPRRVSKSARDAVRRLCRPSPADRLTFDDFRNHPFFTHPNSFDWTSLRNWTMTPPFVPTVTSATDITNLLGARKLVSPIPGASLLSSCGSSGGGSTSTTSSTMAAPAAVDAMAGALFKNSAANQSYYTSTAMSGANNEWSKDF